MTFDQIKEIAESQNWAMTQYEDDFSLTEKEFVFRQLSFGLHYSMVARGETPEEIVAAVQRSANDFDADTYVRILMSYPTADMDKIQLRVNEIQKRLKMLSDALSIDKDVTEENTMEEIL